MFGLRRTLSAAPFFSLTLALLLSGCGGVETQAAPNTASPDQVTGEADPAPQHDARVLETAMAAIPAGGTDDERIRAILLHLKAKRDSITSYTMDIAWERYEFPETPIESPLPNGVKVNYGEGTWTEQNGMWRVHRRKRWERPVEPDPESNAIRHDTGDLGEYESWAVYNGHYFAFRHRDASIQFFPQAAIDAKVVLHEPELFPFPLEWGFSHGKQDDLIASYDAWRQSARCELDEIETPDGPKFRLRVNLKNGAGTERVFDPLRDFLIVRSAGWDANRRLSEVVIELQKLPDGRWFPSRGTQRDEEKMATYIFRNVNINVPIDDSQFTVESFDFDRFTTILVKRGGSRFDSGAKMLFREGQWVPQSMVPAHLRPPKKKKVFYGGPENK